MKKIPSNKGFAGSYWKSRTFWIFQFMSSLASILNELENVQKIRIYRYFVIALLLKDFNDKD